MDGLALMYASQYLGLESEQVKRFLDKRLSSEIEGAPVLCRSQLQLYNSHPLLSAAAWQPSPLRAAEPQMSAHFMVAEALQQGQPMLAGCSAV